MQRARQETKALLNAGHRVVVITDLKHFSQLDYFKETRNKPEIIPVKTFFLYGFRSVSSRITFAFKAYYALKMLSEKESIDLVIEHSAISYAAPRFSKFKVCPTVCVIHDLIKNRAETGNPYNRLETYLRLHAYNYAIPRVDFIVATSIYSKKLMLRDGVNPEKIFIKYNTIDTVAFSPDEKVEKDIDLLFIGRLSIEKGIDIFIEAIKQLTVKKRIVIIGDGPLEHDMKVLAKNINQDIKFEGWVQYQDLPKFIRRSKLVIAPSRSEVHAAVPLLSMACGIPVIASRVSGMEDSIEHNKSGWLLSRNHPKILINLVEDILGDISKLKNAGKEALLRAEIFSEKRFSHEIVEFYEMLIKKYYS